MEQALVIQKEVMKLLGTDEVYLVGGSVRDIVLDNKPKDYDFTTPMLPDDIIAAVKTHGRKTYEIGKKFGTIGFKVPMMHYTPVIEDGKGTMDKKPVFEYVEVTTFRSEVYTNKSRKPEVQFVPSLDEDLARRDFTFNAMVLKPDGKIYDPHGGKLDILAEQIKTVGLPKDRIQEDPLRMLRAARFAARYAYHIDPNFIGKARQLADRIYDVSTERWVQELDKLLTSEYMMFGLLSLKDMTLLERILPELPDTSGLAFRVDKDPDVAWQYLLTHTHKNEKIRRYINSGICARLKFSNARTKLILS